MSREPEERKKQHARKLGSIVNQLMARRGYAQVQTGNEMERIVRRVVGDNLANTCRPGNVRNGTLEIAVSDSVSIQELSFQKRALIKALQKEFPQSGIKDIRFRAG
ncbi:DUF721 domain-containing protein [Rosistilla oblonga]|uniref:DUF721 domain-containing protein n=1 Tax=Rosistilla oblonga TaxID=2527990 RepID=UPI003A96F62B